MIIVYIKKDRFFKNVNPYGNIFEIKYPTREITTENGKKIKTYYDKYIEDGYTKIELEEKYFDCKYQDFNEDLTFSVEKYNNRKQKCISEQEIIKIKEWFEEEYTYKEQKFRRLISLNKLDDDGIDAKTKLTELYIEAESKRTKIQMLENEV